jgi:dTDP-4-amino-4,6-dideoxygalactose transaminase
VIPFYDAGASYREIAQEIDEAVARVNASGLYIGGGEVAGFEEAWASYCGAKHCVGVGNGLEALALSLRALGVGAGDEVIVPSNTYIATWLAVSMVGATPVPVEPNAAFHGIQPDAVEAAITPRTRCIMPVHLYGHPCPIDDLVELAARNGLTVVEDAAQAHGAAVNGRKIGAHGDAVAWSFYPTKNLGAHGDAGAVTTNRPDIAERIRLLGNYGSRVKNVHEVHGFNSRLDPLQAAVLAVKLRHLDEWNNRRCAVASLYGDLLADCGLMLPAVANWASPVWHLYVVQSEQRDWLASKLAEGGVQTMVHYPTPPHLQGAYADAPVRGRGMPIAERLAETVLSLPMGPHLEADQAQQVAAAVRQSLRS